ncbi:FAD-dependent oxidoreductase [Gilvimarinus sp. F26214L]|uniref:FAD-dependent oxidoreductase n=1 Tax=Gilvimarinus sp. DZF01 TaxID=3461371 RepID=UPI0040466895
MSLRSENLERLQHEQFDVLILGGGINGAVSAAALSAKGLRVALIDRGDFAGACSSNSSNLAWGGIKYLESGELLLVSKLCRSRNHLMRHYPASVREIRFFTTIRKGFRLPVFLVYLGALFYWFIGAFRTRPPRYLRRRTIVREEPVVSMKDVVGGFEYSDCYLPDNDARFVFRFVRSGLASGCAAANYVEAMGSEFSDGSWRTRARDLMKGESFEIRSRVLINACGPYVDEYNRRIAQETAHHHLFSKGIHLIVDQITPHDRVLTFFASDGRLFFVIPMGLKTCIGTTDTPVEDPYVQVTEEDRQFVLDNANMLLNLPRPLTTKDIIAERCGVRPLAVKRIDQDESRDWLKLSRRHAIDTDEVKNFISIFGGKLTDCLNVGEEVVDLVKGFGLHPPHPWRGWYGEPDTRQQDRFMDRAAALDINHKFQTLSGEGLSQRLWRRYGELAFELLDEIAENPEEALHKPIDTIDYSRCELALMARTEMITTVDDFLRRRSKVAQVLRAEEIVEHPGFAELCEILFPAEGERKCREYRNAQIAVGALAAAGPQSGA